MRIAVRTIVFMLLLAVVSVGIAWRLEWFGSEAKKDNLTASGGTAGKEAPPQAINAYIVKGEPLEDKISSVGSVIANEEVDLKCEIAGKITHIYFQEGSIVSKGQLLLQLNDDELQAELKRAIIQKDLLEKKKARDEKLLQRQGISQEEFESLTAQLDAQNATIEAIQSQIAKTRLLAPFSGQIGLRYVSEGSYVTPATRIANLIDLSSVKVDFSIPEKYMGVVRKGMKIIFTVAGGTKEYTGSVYAIEPKVEAATRTIQIRAVCGNPDREILPGAFASVKIVLNKIDNALLVPTEAIISEMDSKKVFLVKDGKATPAMVKTGIRTESKIQILAGVAVGDTVITTGLLQIRPGSTVKPVEVK
ncbi:MAG: efflux RND transporter periplasmic adaptor subunit [Cytophagales bacterium]|nr:efflux RND transporter periplasmic adaptor subunit [Bernardetiaceae bacterium]MDW8203786.1 efflux RND transporter periplasmic adaptor subunit [Cytophagales bacterium]